MPRYYFHFHDGSSSFDDETGEVFADPAAALRQARRIALELARGGEGANAAIIVTDGDLRLFEVRLPEHRD
jgi:uncharacterized protein DUF6894